jgi:pseudouridine-5'-monophosphatase
MMLTFSFVRILRSFPVPLMLSIQWPQSFPPGSLPADYTPELYLKEREALQDAAFRVVKPLPGAVELVERLKASGIPLALATGSSDAAFKIKTVSSGTVPLLLARTALSIALPTLPASSFRSPFVPPQSHLTSLFSSFGPHVITASSPPVPPQTTPSRGKPFPDPYLSAARSLGFNVGTEEEPASEEERLERAKGLVFEDAVPGVRVSLLFSIAQRALVWSA